jgi:hypothetical protein
MYLVIYVKIILKISKNYRKKTLNKSSRFVEKWRLTFIRDILARKGVMGVFGNEKK